LTGTETTLITTTELDGVLPIMATQTPNMSNTKTSVLASISEPTETTALLQRSENNRPNGSLSKEVRNLLWTAAPVSLQIEED
jgi:hypothetical protein